MQCVQRDIQMANFKAEMLISNLRCRLDKQYKTPKKLVRWTENKRKALLREANWPFQRVSETPKRAKMQVKATKKT